MLITIWCIINTMALLALAFLFWRFRKGCIHDLSALLKAFNELYTTMIHNDNLFLKTGHNLARAVYLISVATKTDLTKDHEISISDLLSDANNTPDENVG